MKKQKIIFWTATIIIALFDGLIPALTTQTKLAREGISHLGYPDYFGNLLLCFRIPGVLVLLIPQIPGRVKEWAYAGFAIEFISAAISHALVDGFAGNTFLPLAVLAVLIVSYISYHKLNPVKI